MTEAGLEGRTLTGEMLRLKWEVLCLFGVAVVQVGVSRVHIRDVVIQDGDSEIQWEMLGFRWECWVRQVSQVRAVKDEASTEDREAS